MPDAAHGSPSCDAFNLTESYLQLGPSQMYGKYLGANAEGPQLGMRLFLQICRFIRSIFIEQCQLITPQERSSKTFARNRLLRLINVTIRQQSVKSKERVTLRDKL